MAHRNPFIRPIPLALVVIAVLGACSQDPAAVAKRKLRSAFGDDAKQIEIRIEGSTATLTGTVSQRSTQELAEEVARSLAGVTSVDNRIVGPEPRGLEKLRAEAIDAALEMDVVATLVRKAGSSTAQALEVEAADGVVSLRGTVNESDARSRALELTERVDGVRKVIDLIEVRDGSG